MNLVERYARLWATTSPDLHALDTFLAAAPNCPASELAEILRTDLTASVRRAIVDADSELREALASRAAFG